MSQKRVFVFYCCILTSNLVLAATSALPQKIDPKAHYVFYLHGKIIEDQGIHPKNPQYGYYEYEEILQTFDRRGFTVISEARAKDTDPAEYAEKVIRQIQTLLSSRVSPSNLCVIGASKGGVIAELVSTGLKNPGVRFVLLGSCNEVIEHTYHPDLAGEVLSIYERSDQIGRSCKKIFAKSTRLTRSDEIQLHMGNAHGFLYRPVKEWAEPAANWCLGSGAK